MMSAIKIHLLLLAVLLVGGAFAAAAAEPLAFDKWVREGGEMATDAVAKPESGPFSSPLPCHYHYDGRVVRAKDDEDIQECMGIYFGPEEIDFSKPPDFHNPNTYAPFYREGIAPDIGASAAYARGHTGQGVRMANLENYWSGHEELAGQVEYYILYEEDGEFQIRKTNLD